MKKLPLGPNLARSKTSVRWRTLQDEFKEHRLGAQALPLLAYIFA